MLAAANILLSSLKQFEMITAMCMGLPWYFPCKHKQIQLLKIKNLGFRSGNLNQCDFSVWAQFRVGEKDFPDVLDLC